MTTTNTTPTAFDPTTIPLVRARIAELRKQRCHLTASIMRDEMLSQVEAWLDPEGATIMRDIRTAQGKAALELSLAIDPACGF